MWKNQEYNPLDFLDEDEQGNYIPNPVRLQTCLSQMRLLETKLRKEQTKVKTIEHNFSETNAKTKKYCSENESLRVNISNLEYKVLDLKRREQTMNCNLSEATEKFQKFITESIDNKNEIERLSKENLKLCSKLKDFEKESKSLENQVLEKDKLIEVYNKEMKAMISYQQSSSCSDNENKVHSPPLAATINELDKKLSTDSDLVTQFSNENTHLLNENLNPTKSKLDEFKELATSWEGKYDQSVIRIQDLTNKLRTKDEIIKVFEKETNTHVTKTKFDQKVMFYQNELRTRDEIIKDFEKEMNSLKEQALKKDEVIEDFEKEIISLKEKEKYLKKNKLIQVYEKEMKEMEAQIFDLQKKINASGKKCSVREQTNQLIFPNKPKEFRFFKPQEGLGYDSKKNLVKATYQAPGLYDSNLLGKADIKMAFIRSFKDIEEQEDAKRPIFNETQTSFDYKSLNESYKTKKIPLSDNDFPTYTEEELHFDEALKQVVFQKVYIPTLILEKQFSELQKTLECRTKQFENEKRNFLEKIAFFEQASLDKSSIPTVKSSLETVDNIPNLSQQESSKLFSSNEKLLEKISFLKDALISKDKDIDILTEKINSMWKMNGSFSPNTPIIPQEEKQKSKLVENDSKPDVRVPLKVFKGKSSKPFSKVISPISTSSSKKNQNYSSKSQQNETSTSSLKTSSSKSTILENKHVSKDKICSPMTKHETKSFMYSIPELFEYAPSHFKLSVQRAFNFDSKTKQQASKTNNKTNFIPKTPPPFHQQKWIPRSSKTSSTNNMQSFVPNTSFSGPKQQCFPKFSQSKNKNKNSQKTQQASINPKSLNKQTFVPRTPIPTHERKWIPTSPPISKINTPISKPITSKVCLPEKWNSYSLHIINTTYQWFSNKTNKNGPKMQWVPKEVKCDCAGK